MVKFDRKNTEKAKAAILSLKRAEELKRTYNTPQVNEALLEMFYGKCYICENREMTSMQIEHLRPHKEQPKLKYDWNNLFLSCAHCNSIKGMKYDSILDCSKVDVDLKIAFRKTGYFKSDITYDFQALEEDISVKNTVRLLYEVYYGNTPQKRFEASNIRLILRRNLLGFENLLREYEHAGADEREDIKYAIRAEVHAKAPFAAFKRWILRDDKKRYQDILDFCEKE